MTKIIIIALIIDAIHYTLMDGEIFGWLGKWLYETLPEWLHEPVFYCNICMTPWYGSLLMLAIWQTWCWWIVLAAMGLNVVINTICKQ